MRCQVIEHRVLDTLVGVMFSYRANEFVRHSILDTFRTLLRGGIQYSKLREGTYV